MPRKKKRCASDAGWFPCNVPSECSFQLECYSMTVAKQKCGFGFYTTSGMQPRYAHGEVNFWTTYHGEGSNLDNCFCPEDETATVSYTNDQPEASRIVSVGTSCPDPTCAVTSAVGTYDHHGVVSECVDSPVDLTLAYCPGILSEWMDGAAMARSNLLTVWDSAFGQLQTRPHVNPFCGDSEWGLSVDSAPTYRKWTYSETVEDPDCIDNHCGSEGTWTIEAEGEYEVTLSDEITTAELLEWCLTAGDTGVIEEPDEPTLESNGYYTSHSPGAGCSACLHLNEAETVLHWTSALVRVTNTSAETIVVFWTREDYAIDDTSEAPCTPADDPEDSYSSSVTLTPGATHDITLSRDPMGANGVSKLVNFGCYKLE